MYDPPKHQTNFDDVGDFHTKFGLESVTSGGAHPREVTRELMQFRLNFMIEELMELIQAVGGNLVVTQRLDEMRKVEAQLPETWTPEDIDHAEAFDALIDEAYVTFGLGHLLGYPWKVGWDMVQRANMRKVRAEKAEDSERGGTWDVVKPPGWKPPNIHAVLYTHGWPIEGYAAHFTPDIDSEDIK